MAQLCLISTDTDIEVTEYILVFYFILFYFKNKTHADFQRWILYKIVKVLVMFMFTIQDSSTD